MAKNGNGPTVIGIDFGGDGLRVATDRKGEPAVIPLHCSSGPLRRVIRVQNGQEADLAGYRVLSLKRILDFDEVFSSQIKEVNVLEYVRQLFRHVHEDEMLVGVGEAARVVGAVPPCFSQKQRSALRTAITDAGFTRTKLVDDSVAALLASSDQLQDKSNILVYAWGASTFCASLYRPWGGGFKAIAAPEGDRQLGGDDIDSALLRYLEKAFSGQWYVDFGKISGVLFQELERVKLELVEGRRACITLRGLGLVRKHGGNADGEVEIPRAVLDEAVSVMQSKTFTLVDKVLAGGDCPNPDAVLVLGGTTQIPDVERRLEERFPGRLVRAGRNAVVLGTVLHGRTLPTEEWEVAKKKGDASPRSERPVETRPAPEARPSQDQRQSPKGREESWSAILKLDPILDKAQEFERAGRLDKAVETLDELHAKLGKFSSIVYDRAAQAHADRAQDDVVFRLLRQASLLDPTNVQVAGRYAALCGKRSEQYKKANRYRDAWGFAYEAVCAIERLPGVESRYPRDLAAVLFREACILVILGRVKEAQDHLLRCMELDPQESAYEKALEETRALRKKNPSLLQRARASMSSHKVKRNDLCPCGSGRKYKKCCGKTR